MSHKYDGITTKSAYHTALSPLSLIFFHDATVHPTPAGVSHISNWITVVLDYPK